MRRDDPRVQELELGRREPLPAPAVAVLEALGPLVTERRLKRLRTVAAGRLRSVAPVLESIADPHNASAILRSADAFGIQQVHVVPGPAGFHASRQISKGAHRWLDLQRHLDSAACADALRDAGYAIFVASMEGTVSPADLAKRPKVAVVFGNEHRGPSPAMRERAEGTYAIPMRGFVESLNVSVAAAITLHALTTDRVGELSEGERDELVARWLLSTVRDGERVVRDHLAGAREVSPLPER